MLVHPLDMVDLHSVRTDGLILVSYSLASAKVGVLLLLLFLSLEQFATEVCLVLLAVLVLKTEDALSLEGFVVFLVDHVETSWQGGYVSVSKEKLEEVCTEAY